MRGQAIIAALVVGTLITLAVTALVMQAMQRLLRKGQCVNPDTHLEQIWVYLSASPLFGLTMT